MRRPTRSWTTFLMQFVPLLVCCMVIAACNGAPGLGDLSSQPTADVFLRGFSNVGIPLDNNNGNVPVGFMPLTEIKMKPNNNNATACDQQTSYPDIFAVLSVANGVSAVLQSIVVHFSEIDGSPLLDFSVTPPASRGNEFDYIVNAPVIIEAPPITNLPSGLGDNTGQIGNVFVPIDFGETNVFCGFIVPQFSFNPRPVLVRLTMSGQDIFGHPFTLVGFLNFPPIIQTS